MRVAIVPVVLAAAVAVMSGGVAALTPLAPEVPRTTGVIHGWDLEDDDRPLVTAVRIENPNRFPVVVTAIHYDIVDGEGVVVGEGLTAPRVLVRGGDDRLLVLRTAVDDAATEGGDPAAYGVEGVLLVTCLGVPVPVPFSHGPGGDGARVPALHTGGR